MNGVRTQMRKRFPRGLYVRCAQIESVFLTI
jgi:hypothetical protein